MQILVLDVGERVTDISSVFLSCPWSQERIGTLRDRPDGVNREIRLSLIDRPESRIGILNEGLGEELCSQ